MTTRGGGNPSPLPPAGGTFLPLKHIPITPNSSYEILIRLDTLPQTLNMGIHRAIGTHIVLAPHLVEYGLPGKGSVGVGGQKQQQIVFPGS